MKIGFVLDDGLDKPDGVQQYITNLGEYFRSQGHEVRYLVGETKRRDFDGIHPLAKNIRVRFNGNALSVPMPASTRRINDLLLEEDFDVLHIQTPHSPFMGAKVVKQAADKTAVVGTFHILPYGWLSRLGTRLLGLWLKLNLRRFDSFISVSEPAAAFAQASFKIESQVIPNSVDVSAFKRRGLRKKDDQLRLLFVGRLVQRKGCKQLIDALQLLYKEGKMPANWRLDVCGSGPMMRELMERARHGGLEDYIEFHGFISAEKKIDLMRHADISIFPSLSGESFGIVLIEAMAAGGGIVLGGRNPGYASVLHEVPDSLIDSRQPGRMAAQLEHFIVDDHARRQLYGAQQKHVKRFDTPVVAKKVLAVYETCKKQRSN